MFFDLRGYLSTVLIEKKREKNLKMERSKAAIMKNFGASTAIQKKVYSEGQKQINFRVRCSL